MCVLAPNVETPNAKTVCIVFIMLGIFSSVIWLSGYVYYYHYYHYRASKFAKMVFWAPEENVILKFALESLDPPTTTTTPTTTVTYPIGCGDKYPASLDDDCNPITKWREDWIRPARYVDVGTP